MQALWYSIGATIIISLLSLTGVVLLSLNKKKLDEILLLLVGFSGGVLMGGAFLHLLPEAAENFAFLPIGIMVLVGFCIFFLLEKVLHWHHCHKTGKCDVHPFTYLNLIGDGIHNFIDGLIIAAAFVTSIPVGITTTLAVLSHEIPQEISDFGVLIYGGFSKTKALLMNFLSGIVAIIGAIVGYFIANVVNNFAALLLPFAAGGFLYIAASDLIPELHREKDMKKAFLSFVFFLIGIVFMLIIKILFES